MGGRAYTVFDTVVGRCAIAWSAAGIAGVQLAEAREIETRRQLLRRCPDARESRPNPDVEAAIDGLKALLRGEPADLSNAALDMAEATPFHRRVYELVRTIPRGETLTFAEIATRLGASGAIHSVGQALSKNPFALLVPCHRALPARGETGGTPSCGGMVSRYRLLSIEGALTGRGPTLFDALLSAPPRSTG
ncbi:methylated-DNA--[protein]-cysteine S-methyltransferase [Rhodopseudomonas palustris]|uniref:Methylated-DNA--protein-cysteine methyltransferase n=1 Tax=Rhodopseudomonas palustris (strain BisB18) TaxID=316056 RepID=Q20WR6_RHOPB